jgi:hypothetical protein
MEDLRKLRRRVEAEADDLNIKVGGFAITPAETEDGNDILNCAFFLTAESVETIEETEQRKVDDTFESIFGAEFGDVEEFADDETKAMMEKEKADAERRAAEIQRLIEEMEE